MSTLILALYAEGRTDERFLPIVIQRTAEQILAQRGRMTVDVPEPIVLNHSIDRENSKRAARVLTAACRSHGYHALIIHADADHRTPDRAMKERIQPGLKLVQQADAPVCDQIVPIIPVQMTEAWMLTDPETLCQVIGTNVQPQALGLPVHTHQVESDSTPKQTLNQVIQNAFANRARRRRRINVGTIYEPLARQIRLERLRGVPSYQQFMQDMTDALIILHMADAV